MIKGLFNNQNVQVLMDIYSYNDQEGTFTKFKIPKAFKGHVHLASMSVPKARRYGATFTNFKDKYIFVVGGLDRNNRMGLSVQPVAKDVWIYSVKDDWWQRSRYALNADRIHHSCCVLGDYIYTFCGVNSVGDMNLKFER